MILKCPECGSKYVISNINDRCCRKCGYRGKKEIFEVKTDVDQRLKDLLNKNLGITKEGRNE